MSEWSHALCSLGHRLGLHEAFCEAGLKGILLSVRQIPLPHYTVYAVHLCFLLCQQTL